MRIIDCQQRSPEWYAARLGKITGSRFKDVLTQPRTNRDKEAGVLSQTATSYMLDLIAEPLTGKPQGPPTTFAMQHGIEMEPTARGLYETTTGRQVEQVGFIDHATEPLVGCSPDGLVGDDGGIEIKCPLNTRIHLGYMLNGPGEHVTQIQGLLWITGRKWCDFVSYDSHINDLSLALFVQRVERDQVFIDRLESAVRNFRERYQETLKHFQAKGTL